MTRDEGIDGHKPVGIVIGGLGSIAVSVVLVPLRSHIDNANLALILVFVVVCAAIVGGRTAGAVAAIAATLVVRLLLDQAVRVDAHRQRRRHRDGADLVGGRPGRGRGRVPGP